MHRHGYWSQTRVLVTDRGNSGTCHSGTDNNNNNNNNNSYIALYPVKIYKLAALYIKIR